MKISSNPAWLIGACTIIGFGAVLSLYLTTDSDDHIKNNFNRKFLPSALSQIRSFDLGYNSYYPAGADATFLYLANKVDPFHLLKTYIHSLDTQHVRLIIRNNVHYNQIFPRVVVRPPFFYLADGELPAVLRGDVNTWEASFFLSHPEFFVESVPIGPGSIAFRAISKQRENLLGKASSDTSRARLAVNLLQKQIDGIFCTDGMLHYSPELNMLVYLYYYRNEFICADSSLNLIYRGHTVDTVSRARIKVASIKSERSITLSAPALVTNKNSCVAGKLLYVQSNLVADNEDRKAFNTYAVVDVYDLQTGAYCYSFSIPNHNGIKMTSFLVAGQYFFALHEQYLIVYRLNESFL